MSASEQKPILRRRIVKFAVGFAVSLAIGKVLETITDRDSIDGIYQLQGDWIAAVRQMSPLNLIGVFILQMGEVEGGGFLTPLFALWGTAGSYLDTGAIAGLMQIGMGALALGALNMVHSKGKSVFLGSSGEDGRLPINLAGLPLAVVALGSGLALSLQWIMLGALFLFHWITGLAAIAAGATGVVGFCWYCLAKLGEKGAEQVLTPQI